MWTCPKCGKQLARKDQQHFCIKPESIDEYISQQAESVQPRLQAIRQTIREAIPDAQEKISWQMPTYWKGRNIIHFAASKKHIGLYPGGEAAEVFADRLSAAQIVSCKSENVKAVVMRGGSEASHAAVILRSMGIVAVFGVPYTSEDVSDKKECIVDGKNGIVIISPTAEEKE